MPSNDYTSKTWKVVAAGDLAICKPGDEVKIIELPNQEVVIQCGENPPLNGKYMQGVNKISSDGFEISLQIMFVSKSSNAIGGSWTAEDNPSGPTE